LFNKRRAKQWFYVSVLLHSAAVAMLLYRIKDPVYSLPVEVVATAAGAVLTWLQAKKHNELNSSYALAAHEIALIKGGARTADIAGEAVKAAIKEGTREIDVAMAGRDAMELEISRAYPDSELRDSWVWFQAGLNTDGAHNPVTTAKLKMGDILSLNTFPMISGYYTALERTLFLGEPDADSLRIWQANVGAHELGLSLIKPGATCSGICAEINRFFEDLDLLQYRSFGYGHSFGALSHYYGREAGLELREDIDTVLEPGMVVSMEPMLTLPLGTPGAGGYREHDILVVGEDNAENITGFPYGPEFNIVGA
jgi:creatinase